MKSFKKLGLGTPPLKEREIKLFSLVTGFEVPSKCSATSTYLFEVATRNSNQNKGCVIVIVPLL
jgi:hypothetical protein